MKVKIRKNIFLLFLAYLLISVTILFFIWAVYKKSYSSIPMTAFLIYYFIFLINNLKKQL